MRRATFLTGLFAIGLSAAGGTGESVAQESAETEETSATARAMAELSAAYEKVAGLLDQGSDEAADRVQGDLENLGDWEYRVVTLTSESPEAIEAELNTLGDERWEVYWIESADDDIRVWLKRPSISYLSRVPLSTLLRVLATGAQ